MKRKLRIRKETIRNLADGHLAAVAGGVDLTRPRSVNDCQGTLTAGIDCDPYYTAGGNCYTGGANTTNSNQCFV